MKLRFSKNYVTASTLKNLLDGFPRSRGARLDLALEEGKKLFEDNPDPKAKKVLIVVMDKQSDSLITDVESAAR